jgi:hypothetical protein
VEVDEKREGYRSASLSKFQGFSIFPPTSNPDQIPGRTFSEIVPSVMGHSTQQ